jgi:3-deoxy-D-manno-octulosonate 8-phosphate phosphatase (KDO 8-P phosphatase)
MSRASAIKLLLTDCDGVLTDGPVYCDADGEVLLQFSRRDGMGWPGCAKAGIETGIITRAIADRRPPRREAGDRAGAPRDQ